MNEWHQNLALREKRFVLAGAVTLVIIMLYTLVYEPMMVGLDEQTTSLDMRKSELERLAKISGEYKALGVSGNKRSVKDKRSILAVIDQTSSAVGIKKSIKRITPEGKNKVRVRVEDVAFDNLLEWLVINSTKHKIRAELFLARKTDIKGKGNATLLFSRE